jgi:AcrR family transcriptional regulator
VGSPLPDLRALTRDNVRAQIGETAWTVFAERGFDAVTVDEVARAAGVSRASFFRYFGRKEEAVFVALEAMGAEIATALSERPAGEDAWTALRRAFDSTLRNYRVDPDRALARLQLIRETPSLRAHQREKLLQWQTMIGPVLAERLGEQRLDLQAECLASAALNALDIAAERWAASGGALKLPDLLDEAFAVLSGPAPLLVDVD